MLSLYRIGPACAQWSFVKCAVLNQVYTHNKTPHPISYLAICTLGEEARKRENSSPKVGGELEPDFDSRFGGQKSLSNRVLPRYWWTARYREIYVQVGVSLAGVFDIVRFAEVHDVQESVWTPRKRRPACQ